MTLPLLPVDRKKAAQREMWDATPLGHQTLYVVFWRKRCPSRRVIRKYVAASRTGFTENRYRAWKTTSIDEAKRVAGNTKGGHVAEFKP